MSCLVPLPVMLPLLGAALTLLLPRRPRTQRRSASRCSPPSSRSPALLLVLADRHGPLVVEVGGWPAPLGISAGRRPALRADARWSRPW